MCPKCCVSIENALITQRLTLFFIRLNAQQSTEGLELLTEKHIAYV